MSSGLEAQIDPGRCLKFEFTASTSIIHVTDTCRNQLIYVGAVPLHGHWQFIGEGCIQITAKPGRDTLVADTTYVTRVLPDTTVYDTLYAEIMRHEQDTVLWRDTCSVAGSCMKLVTVTRGHYDSVRVRCDDSIAVCDTVCQYGWVVPRDSLYYVWTASERATIESKIASYTWAENKCILIRMLPDSTGIDDRSQQRGYWDPFPDTVDCSVPQPPGYRKYPLSYWITATSSLIYSTRPPKQMQHAAVTDTAWQEFDCATWDNYPNEFKRSGVRDCRFEPYTYYKVQLQYVQDSDTTMMIDTCRVPCPKVVARASGHYVDSTTVSGWMEYIWETRERDTCYTVGTADKTWSTPETLHVWVQADTVTDYVYQGWWNQFSSYSELSDSLCSPTGTVPIIIPFYGSVGGWYNARVRGYDIANPIQPCPPYDPLLELCCLMDTTKFQARRFLDWIRTGGASGVPMPGEPYRRVVAGCRSEILKGKPEYGCWTWKDTTVTCMYPDTVNGEPVNRKTTFSFSLRRPAPCPTITTCDTIRYRVIVDSVWHGDTLRTQVWVPTGWTYDVIDTCACSPVITLPDGVPHDWCGEITLRSECDPQPYWQGNTIVIPCRAEGAGVTINGITAREFTGIAQAADVETKHAEMLWLTATQRDSIAAHRAIFSALRDTSGTWFYNQVRPPYSEGNDYWRFPKITGSEWYFGSGQISTKPDSSYLRIDIGDISRIDFGVDQKLALSANYGVTVPSAYSHFGYGDPDSLRVANVGYVDKEIAKNSAFDSSLYYKQKWALLNMLADSMKAIFDMIGHSAQADSLWHELGFMFRMADTSKLHRQEWAAIASRADSISNAVSLKLNATALDSTYIIRCDSVYFSSTTGYVVIPNAYNIMSVTYGFKPGAAPSFPASVTLVGRAEGGKQYYLRGALSALYIIYYYKKI